jgi:hypothetical protein
MLTTLDPSAYLETEEYGEEWRRKRCCWHYSSCQVYSSGQREMLQSRMRREVTGAVAAADAVAAAHVPAS